MASESKGAVLAAMGANAAIAAGKLVAGLLTHSAAMLAEAGHSVADTVNQVFLLIGINLSDTAADERHPHGYGKEPFFWSFLAAIFIFVAGAAFSFYEGTRTLAQDADHHRSDFELLLAFGVLGGGMVFELISYAVVIRALRKGSKARGWGFVRFLRESPDITLKTVFFEDSAAIIGLLLAAGGLGLSETTGNENWDAIASLCIGVVLTAVAFMLGLQARNLLLGAAANLETRAAIDRVVATFPEVERVQRILTMQLGSHSVLVTGELELRRDLTAAAAADLLARIDSRLEDEVPEVSDTFWELHAGDRPHPAADTPPHAGA